MKNTTTYVRLVKKPQSGGAQQSKKSRALPESSDKARASKKKIFEIGVTLKSSKIEETFEIVPPLTLRS